MSTTLYVLARRNDAFWGLPLDEALACFGDAVMRAEDGSWLLDGYGCYTLRFDEAHLYSCVLSVTVEDGLATVIAIERPTARRALYEGVFALMQKGLYGAFLDTGSPFVTASEEAMAKADPDLIESFSPPLVARDARDLVEKMFNADVSEVWDDS